MKHLRSDYDAIQPWPTSREHVVKADGETVSLHDFAATPSKVPDEYEPIIPDDEPVFLLRAKDTIAPKLVRQWADILDMRGEHNQELAPAEQCEVCTLVRRVLEWADEMENYATEHYDGGKVPDVPEGFLP